MVQDGDLEEALRKVLKQGADWQRVPVKGVEGAFILRAPGYRGRPPALMVELNPLGPDGVPKKRRGLILRSVGELEEFRALISAERLVEVLKAVEKVNPQREAGEEFEV